MNAGTGGTTGTTARRLWLDGDPGFDDWLAWLLVMALPGVTVAGIGVVAGNAPLATLCDNARRIRALHGWTVPIHAGCDRPLSAAPVTAAYVLGEAAMATTGVPLPPLPATAGAAGGSGGSGTAAAAAADSQDAVGALLRHLHHLRHGAGDQACTTVLATGPLTNLATAWLRDPAAFERVDEIVLMGGSTDRGNHTPAAEFNIAADPEAADVVFRSGVPLRMFGLNLCRQLGLTQHHVQQVRQWPGAAAACLAGHLDAYQRIASADGSRPMPLYDPAPVLWLAQPQWFGFQAAPVDIELHGRFTRGMTVCDLRNRAGRPCHVQVALQVQADAAMALCLRLARQALQLA